MDTKFETTMQDEKRVLSQSELDEVAGAGLLGDIWNKLFGSGPNISTTVHVCYGGGSHGYGKPSRSGKGTGPGTQTHMN